MKWIRAEIVAMLSRPLGKAGWLILLGVILTGPAWLFFAPTEPITRLPLSTYRLHRDDFEYLARSRTFSSTIANLFVPHNTHVVPAWRFVTWGMVVVSGRLSRCPSVLGIAAYGILTAAMLLMGRLVTRETGRPAIGLAASILTGTTSVMLSAASWYSAGQTLWAGVAVLAMLSWLQQWRRRGGMAPLILAGIAAALSGWLWTVGHIAGLVGAAYLLADRRPASRRAALFPFLASVAAVAITAVLARGEVRIETGYESGVKGKKGDVISVRSGISHTFQAIPETLVLGNLGLMVETVPSQGAILSLGILALWGWSRRRPRGTMGMTTADRTWPNRLEAAGGVMVAAAYLLEWTFRGYLPFSSLRWQVPWYDTIPQVGAVLFAAGWGSALLDSPSADATGTLGRSLRRGEAIGLIMLVFALVTANRPRVEEKWHYLAPAMLASDRMLFVDFLRSQRDNYLFNEQAAWQYRHLLKLERAEAFAIRQGIGRAEIHATFGKLDAPLIPSVYDALGLLDLPEHGAAISPSSMKTLAPLLAVDPEPRPPWLKRGEPWPPPVADGQQRAGR